MAGALEMAAEIAARSPVAVQGTKLNLIYSRDHSVDEGLHYMVRTFHVLCPRPGVNFESSITSRRKQTFCN